MSCEQRNFVAHSLRFAPPLCRANKNAAAEYTRIRLYFACREVLSFLLCPKVRFCTPNKISFTALWKTKPLNSSTRRSFSLVILVVCVDFHCERTYTIRYFHSPNPASRQSVII